MKGRSGHAIRLHVITAVLLAATNAGCADPADDCDVSDVCVPAAADIAVKQVSVRSSATDASTGRAVVQPDAIDVTIVLRNNGGAASESKSVLVQLGGRDVALATVPSLAPSGEFTRTVHLDPPDTDFLLTTDSTDVRAIVVGLDADDTNNERASAPFHLALPVLKVTTTFDSTIVRGTATVPASVRIENVSRYAALGPSTVVYCLSDPDRHCGDASSVTFNSLHVAGLAVGEAVVLSRPLMIPSQSVDQNRILSYAVATCVTTAALASSSNVGCGASRTITFVPDYETCAPVRMTPGTVAVATTGCTVPCDIAVFSVDVVAGHSYFVETDTGAQESTLRWRTRFRDDPADASPDDGFQPAVSGRYYLVTAPKYCGINIAEQHVVVRDVH
jgi:hypothetical protein